MRRLTAPSRISGGKAVGAESCRGAMQGWTGRYGQKAAYQGNEHLPSRGENAS